VGPEADVFPCFRRHFLSSYEQADRFKREHPTCCCVVETIRWYPLLCCVIADAVELGFSAQLAERFLIVLVRLDVQVVCCEREASAMHHDGLQYIQMAAL
jgi:hypothetical protein